MSLGRQVVSSIVWASLSAYVQFALTFVGNVLLVRLLLPDDFGQFALASALAEILFLAAALNFPQGMIQLQNEPDVDDAAYILSLFVAVGILAAGLAIGAGLSLFYSERVVLVFVALCATRACSVISNVYAAHLEREFRYKAFSMVRLVASNGSMVIALALALRGWGVWSLVGREALFFGLLLFGYGWASRWPWVRRFNRATARRLLDFGLKTFFARGLETLFFRGDSLLIGSLAGTVLLGYYDRSRYLSEFGHITVNQAAVQVAFPLYSRLQEDPQRLSQGCYQIQSAVVRIIGLFALMLILMPDQIVGLVYGPKWLPAAGVLPWLAAYAFFISVTDNTKVLLMATGRLSEAVKVRFWQLAVAIPGIMLGFMQYGLNGVAAGISLGMVAGFMSSQYYMRAYIRISTFRVYVAVLFCMCMAGLMWHGMQSALPALSGYGLILSPFLYSAFLVAVDHDEIRQQVQLVINHSWPQSIQRGEM